MEKLLEQRGRELCARIVGTKSRFEPLAFLKDCVRDWD